MPAEADVLIDVREANAIGAFIDRARDGRLQLEPFVSAPPQVMEAEPVKDIYIAPIEFEPLIAGNVEKGVPQ